MKIIITFDTDPASWKRAGAETHLLYIMKHCYAVVRSQLHRADTDIDADPEIVSGIRDVNGTTIGNVKVARS